MLSVPRCSRGHTTFYLAAQYKPNNGGNLNIYSLSCCKQDKDKNVNLLLEIINSVDNKTTAAFYYLTYRYYITKISLQFEKKTLVLGRSASPIVMQEIHLHVGDNAYSYKQYRRQCNI